MVFEGAMEEKRREYYESIYLTVKRAYRNERDARVITSAIFIMMTSHQKNPEYGPKMAKRFIAGSRGKIKKTLERILRIEIPDLSEK